MSRRRGLEGRLLALASQHRESLVEDFREFAKHDLASDWPDEALRVAVGYHLQQRLLARLRLKVSRAIVHAEQLVQLLSTDSSDVGSSIDPRADRGRRHEDR